MTARDNLRASIKDLADELASFADGKYVPKKKAPKINGRLIDGAYYVRASDVADYLAFRDESPGLAASLRKAANR